jgi:hypothetical protein
MHISKTPQIKKNDQLKFFTKKKQYGRSFHKSDSRAGSKINNSLTDNTSYIHECLS